MVCVCVCFNMLDTSVPSQGWPSVISMEVSSGPEYGTRPEASGDATPAQRIDPKVVEQHRYVVKPCPNISRLALSPALGVFVWLRLFYFKGALRMMTFSR